jgi:hypothetical protein
VSLSRLNGLTLQVERQSLFLGLLFSLGIGLDSLQKVQSAVGVLDVLDAEVDSLFDVAGTDLLVNDDTDRGFCDIVDNTGFTL